MPQREYNEKENTFLLFTEQRTAISYLTDEEAGKMFKAIYAYADEGIIPEFTGSMMSVFSMYRSQIDRCKEAYRKKCEKKMTQIKIGIGVLKNMNIVKKE